MHCVLEVRHLVLESPYRLPQLLHGCEAGAIIYLANRALESVVQRRFKSQFGYPLVQEPLQVVNLL